MASAAMETRDDPRLFVKSATSLDARPVVPRGCAPIKAEYLIERKPMVETAPTQALNSSEVAPFSTKAEEGTEDGNENGKETDQDSKRRKMERKKERKGQNKGRHFPVIRESSVRMCKSFENTGTCEREGCRYAHSWDGYFDCKPKDIHFEPEAILADEQPFVQSSEGKERQAGGEDEVGKTVDLATTCPVYADLGYCPFGWRCRFLGGHISVAVDGEGTNATAGPSKIGGWELKGWSAERGEVGEKWRVKETNWPSMDMLNQLRSNSYEYPISEAYLRKIQPDRPFDLNRKSRGKPDRRNHKRAHDDSHSASTHGANGITGDGPHDEEAMMNLMDQTNGSAPLPKADITELDDEAAQMNGETKQNGLPDGETEAEDVPLRPEEKRRLNWDGELYMAPMCTVGNLPFRRLCVGYGATITCSEMALAQPLVSGQKDEWALGRRHVDEKIFGIQLAGGYANRMVPTAELLSKEIGNGLDFVDVNLGCPIDLVFSQGAGSALLDSPGKLGKILVGMNRALGEVPLTVKMRIGVSSSKPNAHKLIPRFVKEWGCSSLAVHGRSRQQRYSKVADWEYIRQCVDTLHETLEESGMPRVPIFGNGDCFSAQSYWEEKEKSGVDGVMIARGALIKPWIFTEIKERREWDISATERLEGIRKFAEYGLSHWGSDTQGVNITRRFLCESLSFQHRYIPLGLLERLPPMLNERPPAFRGRSELETLLSSPYVGDWVKVSEMFLGPVDESWKFVPKHKSNAYGLEESQG